MIISCPSCGASFNIKAEALGPKGRSVKCSKCAHRWHATASEEPQEAAPAEAAPEPEAPPEPPVAEAASPEAAEPAAETTEIPEAESDDAAPPAVAESPVAEAETADGGSDTEPEEGPPPGLAEALGVAAGAEAETETEDTDEPAAAQRPRRRPKSPARKPRKSMAKVLSIFVLLLVVCGAAGAAVFMKREIMMWMPATQRLYAMIGMQPEVLGQGLQIVEPKPTKEIDGSDEILVVKGEIRNVADEPIEVPLMRGALLDQTGKELHAWTFTAAKSQIGPGDTAQYRTEFRNPPSDAQSLDITFTRAGAAATAEKHDAKLDGHSDESTMPESATQQH
jgi:predicted Zn finger-like uncharacterized protein